MNRLILLLAASAAAWAIWRTQKGASIMPIDFFGSPAPAPVPGYYGPKWGARKPTNLPSSAPGASQPGAAREYLRDLASGKSGGDSTFIAAIDKMGAKESGHTMGRPADAFDSPNKQAWGVFQYFSSSAKDETTFGQYRGQKVWDMPWEVQATAPMERFWIRYKEALDKAKAGRASDTDARIAGVGGMFLHQAKPAWRHRYWASLEAGNNWRQALMDSSQGNNDILAVIRHVETVRNSTTNPGQQMRYTS